MTSTTRSPYGAVVVDGWLLTVIGQYHKTWGGVKRIWVELDILYSHATLSQNARCEPPRRASHALRRS